MFKWMWSYDESITCRKGWEETRGTLHMRTYQCDSHTDDNIQEGTN